MIWINLLKFITSLNTVIRKNNILFCSVLQTDLILKAAVQQWYMFLYFNINLYEYFTEITKLKVTKQMGIIDFNICNILQHIYCDINVQYLKAYDKIWKQP